MTAVFVDQLRSFWQHAPRVALAVLALVAIYRLLAYQPSLAWQKAGEGASSMLFVEATTGMWCVVDTKSPSDPLCYVLPKPRR